MVISVATWILVCSFFFKVTQYFKNWQLGTKILDVSFVIGGILIAIFVSWYVAFPSMG